MKPIIQEGTPNKNNWPTPVLLISFQPDYLWVWQPQVISGICATVAVVQNYVKDVLTVTDKSGMNPGD